MSITPGIGKSKMKIFLVLPAIILTFALSLAVCGAEDSGMKIKMIVGDKILTATLIDSKTSRDFISLLPLSLTLKD